VTRPVALVLAAAACSAPAPAPDKPAAPLGPPTYTWPVPDGWNDEAFDFPLEFVPDLAHTGSEELRFAPGFFDPDAPGYWTYAFVWVLTDDGALDEPTLEAELTAYFRGLSAAVAADRTPPEPLDLTAVRVELAPDATHTLTGTIGTYDVFTKGTSIPFVRLQVAIDVRPCGTGRTVLLTAATRDRPDPIRAALDDVAASFRCDSP
jgi:hypothetical protein